MIKEYSNKDAQMLFHKTQLFAAFLLFLLIPLKNTGIIHYVIWLGVIATTGNIVLTVYNNGIEKNTLCYLLCFSSI